MDLHNQGRQKFIEFPFVSAPHRDLMVNLLSTVEDRLGSHLLPCTLPLDVQHCQNERGSAQASLHVRSGLQSSQIARETMTLLLCPHTHVYLNSFSALPLKKISTRKIRNSIRALSTTPSEMEQPMRGQRLMEFPHLLAPHKDLMAGLISAVDKRLHGHLLPSSASVPPDAEYYQNQSGASQGSLCINRGVDSSHIDFILTSWLHLSLPNGGAMDITNIQGYLKSSTDAPHFQFELVQCSPTYFIFFLDLIPRKDLVLHPDYLKTFYEDSRLEALRKQLETQVLEAKPYFSSSLYFRNVVSPTGILVSITCEDGGTTERAEEIIRDSIEPIANEVLELWMDSCVCKGGTATIEEDERDQLEKRDRMIKSRAIEMDLSSSMPIQFGQEVADRILGVIRSVFRI